MDNIDMIDFTEIPPDGDVWEAFARDFLDHLGFAIDSPPARGADQGKDLIVVEQLQGTLGAYAQRWLVSCKHFAKSGASVSESHEPNLLERVRSFRVDGFMGFYSTLPSAGLNTRLTSLRATGDLCDFRIFDAKLIENYCLRIGYSRLLIRYFPKSYKRIAPLHRITNEYEPMSCRTCGKDLLTELYQNDMPGVVAVARKREEGGPSRIVDVWWACKGACDRRIVEEVRAELGAVSAWEDIGDLAIPYWFLSWVFARLNRLRSGVDVYEDEAFEKMKAFISLMAQKVMREMNEKELERVGRLLTISSAFRG